ncbi:hypothetical protein P7266_1665 [Lactococcus cremoris]|nr:hypothetical protein P7266_1665 [Lactococcus cremoris]
MKVENKVKIDIKRHEVTSKLYDVVVIFTDGTRQSWTKLTEGKVTYLCEKYNPVSIPLSVGLAHKFLPKRLISTPRWSTRLN